MKLLLKNSQCPGDILMMTAAVRDLKTSYPECRIGVQTSAMELWMNNPHVDWEVSSANADRIIECHYPMIHESNRLPFHFINGFRCDLEEQLNLRIPQGDFCCDIHLSEFERKIYDELPRNTWLVDAGGKNDFTNKMWEFARFQEVVNRTKDRINWIQIGSAMHNHRRLENVTDLIGKTSHRGLVSLMYQASGVLTPVSYPMHLATMEWRYGLHRPCVVIAGGREPSVWEAYSCHQYIHNCGSFDCNSRGGCWKARVQRLGDHDEKDSSLCEHPVKSPSGQMIPMCMDMITVDDVVRRIEQYL